MNLINVFFYIVNRVIPKDIRLICMSSFPDYDDQVRALVKEILSNAPQYKIVILTDHKIEPPIWAKNEQISHYKKKSLLGVWFYMHSKFVFFTHGCFSSAKTVPSQTCINIWHGMPIKKIGRYIDKNHKISNSNYMTVTSDFFANKMSYAFGMNKEKMIVTGLPRNDILLGGKNNIIQQKIGDAKKIIVWLPTYRKSIIGEIRLDGTKSDNIFNMPDLEIDKLNTALKNADTVAVIKPHPMAVKNDNTNEYSNIKFIDENWLLENDTTLYEILAQSDLLITDISSVLIDYLVLERPIICHFPDIDSYKDSRGLIWDFKPQDYGIPVVSTQEELLATLKQTLNNDFDKTKLLNLKKLSHDINNDFTGKLLDYFGIGK